MLSMVASWASLFIEGHPNQACGDGEQNEYKRSAVIAYFVGSGITSATRRSVGLTRTMALSPSLTKNECDFACGTLFAISGGIGCNSILSGTRSPIVSVALGELQVLHVFSNDETLFLREIDRSGRRCDGRFLSILRPQDRPRQSGD